MLYVGPHVVKDYRPRPALVTATHLVKNAKFPAIDVHCHFGPEQDPADLLEAMDERNIRAVINLSGGWGERLDRMLEKFHRHAPERLLVFCTPDWSRIDEPDFGTTMAAGLQEAHARGAAGVKVFKNLGLRVRDRTGKLVAIDDPRLDPIWAKAGDLGIPVLIHTADPVAFFQPIDRFNERWMQLQRHPDWSFRGPEFPSREALLAQRNRVIARHRGTTFIGAHVANGSEDLGTVSSWLDEHPNLYVDIAGRVAELGRQPYSARNFFIKYQDRILFGTDRYPGREDQPRYRIYFRFLETDDEYFDYYDHAFPPAGEWKIYGLYLPDLVLQKVYFRNAETVLGRGGPSTQ